MHLFDSQDRKKEKLGLQIAVYKSKKQYYTPKNKTYNVFYGMILVTHFIDYHKVNNRSKPSLV